MTEESWMIYNFNWIIFLPPLSFLRTQRRPVRSQLCYDRFGLLWRLVTPYKWLYSRGNLCVCVIWTYYCCWPRLCSVSQLEKYVYSVLNGVKLCKPRSTSDELFISVLHGAEQSWAACFSLCWRYWLAHCWVKNMFPPLRTCTGQSVSLFASGAC